MPSNHDTLREEQFLNDTTTMIEEVIEYRGGGIGKHIEVEDIPQSWLNDLRKYLEAQRLALLDDVEAKYKKELWAIRRSLDEQGGANNVKQKLDDLLK